MPDATYSLHRLAWDRDRHSAMPVSAVVENAAFETCMRAARREPAEQWLGLYDADGRRLAFRSIRKPEEPDRRPVWEFNDWVPDG